MIEDTKSLSIEVPSKYAFKLESDKIIFDLEKVVKKLVYSLELENGHDFRLIIELTSKISISVIINVSELIKTNEE